MKITCHHCNGVFVANKPGTFRCPHCSRYDVVVEERQRYQTVCAIARQLPAR